MMNKKIIGVNYLHRHPEMEGQKKIDNDHVIIDKKDWQAVVDVFQRNINLIFKIGGELAVSTIDYVKLINELNEELYEKFGQTEYTFNYTTDGEVDMIAFGNIQLWNSEMDDREWIKEKDDYEPLKPFIKLLFNKELDKLSKLKL